MRDKIMTYNQAKAIELGLNIEDLMLLRYFVDFKDTGSMKRMYIEDINNMGYWISYDKIVDDLPILFGNSIAGAKKKIQRMFSGNLSKVVTRKKQTTGEIGNFSGSMIYISLVEETYRMLVSDDKKEQANGQDKNEQSNGQDKNEQSNGQDKNDRCNNLLNNNLLNNNLLSSSSEEKEEDTLIENKDSIQHLLSICQTCKLKLSKDKIELLLKIYSKHELSKAILLTTTATQDIKDPYKYLLTVLADENTNRTKSQEKHLSFNNFEARKYDYDKLEKKLLGWED